MLPALRHHRRIRCEVEAFHSAAVFAEPPLDWTVEARDANRYAYIDHLLNESTWSQHSRDFDPPTNRRDDSTPPYATGFRTSLFQMTRSEFIGLTASPTVKKIVLRRHNFIDMYIEEVRQTENIDKLSSAAVRLDPKALLVHLNAVSSDARCLDFARRYAAERGFPDSWVFVQYEPLVSRETAEETVKSALRLILPASEVDGWTIHALPGVHRDIITKLPKNQTIANFEEVREAIKSERRYLWMLEGGEM